jgi:hypothetical protein
MKRLYILFTAFLLALTISYTAVAQEEGGAAPSDSSSYSAFGIDLGLGFSMGLFDSESAFFYNLAPGDSNKTTRQNLAAIAIIYSFRINIFIDFRFTVLGILSFGVETGLNWLAYEAKANGTNYSGDTFYWFDIPFRGFVRVGIPVIYFQAMGGYYLGLSPIWTYKSAQVLERGPEVGGRLNMFGFYLEAFYIFADLNPHMRVGLGYTAKIF